MNLFQRRNIAILLIILGLIALGFGLWLLISMFLPQNQNGSNMNLPGAGTDLSVTPGNRQAPRTISAPVVVQGTSTPETAPVKSSDVRDAINLATDVVARMGSGSSQSGFLGYDDVMLSGTARFQDFAKQQRQALQTAHPATGATYGVTTRVVSNKVVSGDEGSDAIMILVQAQRTEDAGDRGLPTSVSYYEYTVTLLRQTDGKYLVDEITYKPVTP